MFTASLHDVERFAELDEDEMDEVPRFFEEVATFWVQRLRQFRVRKWRNNEEGGRFLWWTEVAKLKCCRAIQQV